MSGFALEEYVTPKIGFQPGVLGGTMPKAALDAGSMFNQMNRTAKFPGPDHYNKEHDGFSAEGKKKRGGLFSKLGRDWSPGANKRSPAVGQYETSSPQCSPRVKGGAMSNTDRGCVLYDRAVKHGKMTQAPGKYDAKRSEKKVLSPRFSHPTNETRSPTKSQNVGPGTYSINYAAIEKSEPCYSAPKGGGKHYLDHYIKSKEQTPAPGYKGIFQSRHEDQEGRRNHAARLLGDLLLTPREPVPSTPSEPPPELSY